MLLNNYEQQGLLFNMNLKESAGSGLQGYRGELVLVEGEVGDSAGRRKPPLAVLKQVVMLAGEDKMKLVAGLVDDVADLSHFFSRYGADVAADGKAIFFVVNIPAPVKVTTGGVTYELIPLAEGLVWTELCDMFYLEKSDFKGQSAGEKIATVSDAAAGFDSKSPVTDWEAVCANTTGAKRETRGAI